MLKVIRLITNKVCRSGLMTSAFIYTISTFCNSATSFFLLPLLTRYLSTDEYGIISMFNATVSLLTPFVSMGASAAVQRVLVEKKSDNNEYVFNCLLVSAIAFFIVSLGVYVLRDKIYKISGIPINFMIDIMLLVIATVILDISLDIIQIREKAKLYAFLQNFITLLNLISSIIMIVAFDMGLRGRIYGLTYSKLAFSIIGIYLIKKEAGIKPCVNVRYIKDIVFNFGIPLIPIAIKGTVLTYTDRLFITNFVSLSETGVYSVGNQFSLPILLLAQAFNRAFVPWLYKRLEENIEREKIKIVKLTYIYFVVIVGLAVVWSVVSIPIIHFFSGREYYEATIYVFWLSLGYAFTGMYMMVVNYITFFKKLKIYGVLTIIVIFTNIFLNYILIHLFGSVGAAEATMIVNFISFLLTWILVIKICDMPWIYILKRKKI